MNMIRAQKTHLFAYGASTLIYLLIQGRLFSVSTADSFVNLLVVLFALLLGAFTVRATKKNTRKHYSYKEVLSFICVQAWMGAALLFFSYYKNTTAAYIVWILLPFMLACVIFLLQSRLALFHKKNNTTSTSQKRFAIFLLLVAIIVGVGARFYHLGYLGYDTDEGSTALYSWAITQHGVPCRVNFCYLRGFPYLYIVAGVTTLFHHTEFWVRAAGVLVELLGIALLCALSYHFWKSRYIAIFTAIFLLCADWQMMLARYARMYGTMLLFTVSALFAYSQVFYCKKKRWLPILFLAPLLSMLTHQYGLLLIFFILEPFITRRWNLYKNTTFILFSVYLVGITAYTLTQIPGLVYSDPNYLSFYELRPDRLIADKFWYLHIFQWPDFTYIKALFTYYPISILCATFGGYQLIVRKHTHRWFVYFILWVFIATSVYNTEYSLKYLWWMLSILVVLVVYGMDTLWQWKKSYAIILSIALCAQMLFGSYTVLSRDYGKSMSILPVLVPTHVEQYYPDDKTGVEYVLNHAQKDDVIITDYWIQDVYLELLNQKTSDARLTRLGYQEFLKKYPYYKLFKQDGEWHIEKNGPIIISDPSKLIRFISEHSTQRIWYISSVDFSNKTYLYISNLEVNHLINRNFSKDVVYTGKDNNTRVYLIEPNKEASMQY